ncbi:hypothetical protein [Brevundimonas sp.]|uniref:hypothetical protein n=1 Tax=Brevundimonas sp. TaxID=1871086 RepID=UPI0028A15B02|nr:hypothetical protein [Brevundimonas sp.]
MTGCAEGTYTNTTEYRSAVLKVIPSPSPALVALTDDLYVRIRTAQALRRQPKQSDDDAFRASLLAFADAIATFALLRIQPDREMNVAFGDGKYTGSQISSVQLRKIREAMKEAGLIEVLPHFFDRTGEKQSYATRIKPTAAFKALIHLHGVELPPLAPPFPAYFLHKRQHGVRAAPEDVVALDAVVQRYNEFTRQFRLTLPDSAWVALEAYMIAADATGNTTKLHYGFDERRILLTRIFTGTWERGGRMYGGYWQGMPKQFRNQLLIDGQPTIELDYSRLHPTMLFNEAGIALPDNLDPYRVPGFNVDLAGAKQTFNRLLNHDRQITFIAEDQGEWFDDAKSFNEYRDAMVEHLTQIAHYFRNDKGVRLQKKDSELALNVMNRCMDENIAVYPVHDSFIVRHDNAQRLRAIMGDEYAEMMGFICVVK